MPYLEKKLILQIFLEDLLKDVLMTNAWTKFCTYQVFENGVVGPDGIAYRKCVKVMLVRSTGSDGVIRHLGFAYGYDGATGGWGTVRIVEKDSPLGLVGEGDGIKKIFNLRAFPIKPGAILYKNKLPIPDAEYHLDDASGRIVFNVAPLITDRITAYYILDEQAAFPPKSVHVFTFDAIFGEASIVRSPIPGAPGYLGIGDGNTQVFRIPNHPLKDGTTKIYIDDVETPDATVNIGTGDVTFAAAPETGKILTYDTVVIVSNSGYCDIGDKPVDSDNIGFDPYESEGVMAVALNALQYIYPSPPATISFTTDGRIDNLWQFDSYVHCWGNGNRDRMMLFLRFDPTPNPEKTIFCPLYFGRLNLIGVSPRKNHVILTGGRTTEVIPYTANGYIGKYLMDYGPYTSNGNHTVMLQQAIGGARFQAHYLSFITHSQGIDSGEGELSGEYIGGKHTLSPIYITHPNDGPVGKLDDVFAIHPKNVAQMEEFEVNETIPDTTPEEVGVGDGVTDTFYLNFVPVSQELRVQVGCIETAEYTITPDLKRIKFNVPPAAKAVITASYSYSQIYKVVVPTAPICPATLSTACPYVPIGLAVLKENL